ncbi:MAG: glycosyltransferase [Opitutae bacterium]|nr:glycosyltransferase [Opitutae bacterium]
MRLTVAICTYNRAELLRQTLAGLARQTLPADAYEVLVIDNNSTDHTAAVVAEFAHANPAPRRIQESTQGLEHARNRAIAEARGEIILFGDDDILVESTWLTEILAPFDADTAQRIGALGGEVIPVFPDGLPPWVAEWHSPLRFRTDAGPLTPQQSPMGANLAFRRAVFAQVGVFAIGLGRNGKNLFAGDETEMLRRVRAAGLEIWFAPAAAVRHQMPASRTTFRYACRHGFDSARSRVIERVGLHHSTGYLATRLVANVLKLLLFLVLAALNALVFRLGGCKQSLVRAWRSCGYLYQISRLLVGKTV